MQHVIAVPAHAGTAFDGRHLFQIAEAVIQKIDPATGRVIATIPAPGGGGDSGLAWAEGHACGWGSTAPGRSTRSTPTPARSSAPSDPNRVVTGVTWVDDELWHGTMDDDASALQRIDPHTGEVLDVLDMPPGTGVSGA